MTIGLFRSKSNEERHVAVKYICKSLYDNAIQLNVLNSRSSQEIVEAIGQYGHGLNPPSYHEVRGPYLKELVNDVPDLEKPPSYHEVRGPYLKEVDNDVSDLRMKHGQAWNRYGCTHMSDAWSDRKQRYLINFLVNSQEGTLFLGSFNVSSEAHDVPSLAGLVGQKIQEIGVENVVQICTDNGANYKAVGRLLMDKYPKLVVQPIVST